MYRLDSLIGLAVGFMAISDAQTVIDANCGRNYGIVATPGQVIENVTVREARDAAIQVEVDDVTIRNVTIEHGQCGRLSDQYKAGIACWACDRLTIEDSTITISQSGGGNQGYGNGVWVKNASSAGQGGHSFTGNTIRGAYDGIGCETEDHAYGCYVRDTLIAGNTIDGCWDDGIQVEGRTQNVTVRDNAVTNCGTGIALAPSKTGPLLIEGNVLTDMRADSDHGQQNCYKVGDGGSGTVTIRNNICDSLGDGIQQANSGLRVVMHIVGNCFGVSRYIIEFGNKPKPGSTITDNTWQTSDPNRWVKYNGNGFSQSRWANKFPGNAVGGC